MKNNKYLNITMQGESNIGFMDIGVVHTDAKKAVKSIEGELKLKIESKVVEALKGHLDCPVKIILTELKEIYPITLEVTVILETEEQDVQATVYLEETWLY